MARTRARSLATPASGDEKEQSKKSKTRESQADSNYRVDPAWQPREPTRAQLRGAVYCQSRKEEKNGHDDSSRSGGATSWGKLPVFVNPLGLVSDCVMLTTAEK